MKLLYIDAKLIAKVDSENPTGLWTDFQHFYKFYSWEFRSDRIARARNLMEKGGLKGSTFEELFLSWLEKRGIKAEKCQ